VTGLSQPVLLLNQIFLSNSDWRQQEALVALLLGRLQKRTSIVHTIISNLLFVLGWLIFTLFLTSLLQQKTLREADVIFILLSVPTLLFIAPTLFTRYLFLHQIKAADRAGVALTNDPEAAIIAIALIHFLATGDTTLNQMDRQRIQTLAAQVSATSTQSNLFIQPLIQQILIEEKIAFASRPPTTKVLSEQIGIWALPPGRKIAGEEERETPQNDMP
jgi:hypothetical protein